jgi:RNA polymerase sigma-70 factor, ECF subfamily
MLLATHSFTSENEYCPAIQKFSEERLLVAAKLGKPEAFEALCETLMPRLQKVALRITQNREDAEDAVQDSLMRAYIHIKNFQENSTFSTWLTRIVMNSALMIRRKNRNVRQLFSDAPDRNGEFTLPLQIPDHSPNPEQRCVENERRRILRRAVSKLRPRIRAVVEVAQFQELPIKETAKVLDISVAAAKGRFFHARAALRRSRALRSIVQARTEPAA